MNYLNSYTPPRSKAAPVITGKTPNGAPEEELNQAAGVWRAARALISPMPASAMRQQPFDGLNHPAQRSAGGFVDHGIAAMSEEIAGHEHVCRRQKHRDIAIGVGRGLRQQVQFLGSDIERERVVGGQRRPGLARSRNAPRQRGYILAGRQARTAIGIEDRRTGRGKGGVAIGMIEMPVRIDNPLRLRPSTRAVASSISATRGP
jgi:hypothetical protein